jgi:hypothetical protein
MPAKRPGPNRIKRHRSYTIAELARAQGVHKNTVRAWMRAGLTPIDGRPLLFTGEAVRDFLSTTTAGRKRPCPPGMLYCFRCRDRRRPALGMVEFEPRPGGGAGNLKALCGDCGTMMNRRANHKAISRIMPGCDVTIRQADPSLMGHARPRLNCDLIEGD